MNSHHYQSVLPDNSSPLMRAIEKAFRAQLEAVNEPFPQLLNPALTPAQFLSALASEVGVKDWFESDTVSEQRSIVGNGLIIQKEAGTRAGLKRAAESIGVDATVTPWFKTDDGKPYEFYIDAYIEDDETLDALAFERLSARIFHHKSERDLWLVTFKHDPSFGSAYTAPVIRTRKRWTSNNIVPLHVTDITIEPTSIIVYEGEPVSVSATVQMSDGTTTHDVRFESSNASIVTVDGAGLITFAGEGNASVYAISTFNNISSAECTVSALHAITPVAVSINEHGPLYVSASGQLIATVTYSNSNVISSADDASIVAWSSSDESILTIDDNGNYTVLAVGDVTIRATSTEDAAIIGEVETSTAIDYDFVLTVGQPATNNYYYGYSLDSYGNVDPDAWGDSEHVIRGLSTTQDSGSYPLKFSCTEMVPWNGAQNIKMKFFTDTEFAESPISSGFTYIENGLYVFDGAQDAYVLLYHNENQDVYVKVIDASLEINDTIEMTVGLYEGSGFNAWGYRSASSTGETSSTYNSNRTIETCYVRDDTYGMILQSELDNELWLGWEYINATWKLDDGTSHIYAGRLLMHPSQGFYASSVIDDELIALMSSNADKSATVTLSQADTPSNVIEIVIGEIEISEGDTVYGLRGKSDTGAVISGEFPDGCAVRSGYVRTRSYGCLISGEGDAYWNYLTSINVEWVFEDESSYVYPHSLTMAVLSDGERVYRSTTIDETLIEMVSSRVGQKAKIMVTQPGTSKLLTHLHWELDDRAEV